MADTTSEFAWVSLRPDIKDFNISRAERRVIRRQAMSAVSRTWRREGGPNRVNMGQYPIFIQSSSPVSTQKGVVALKTVVSHSPSPNRPSLNIRPATPNRSTIPASVPYSGLERLTAISGINLLNLSTLTVTHVGQTVSEFFNQNPSQLVSLLRQRKVSYLSHIPARFGHSKFLDYALYALISKVREILNPSNLDCRTSALWEYGRALQALQAVIEDPLRRTEPDVLCATELLSLIEVLSLSKENAWAQHVLGASQLLRERGPKGFRTDYEKDLFVSLVAPIMCEAIRTNEQCFLQQQPWQEALDASTIPADKLTSDRGSAVISLRKLAVHLPGLFKNATTMMCHPDDFSGKEVQRLIARVRNLRQEFLQYHAELEDQIRDSRDFSQTPPNSDLMYEMLGTSLVSLAMANRLLSALGDFQAEQLEHDALLYSAEVVRLEEDMISTGGWASFYLTQKVSIAASIRKTAAIWKIAPGKMIEKWRFDRWCSAMQRQICCN
ncbi:hypothetical protein F5884DRAFT_785194 [Xylogone sp. PMI_703]|nr:hypothetical protein F5884DRAFT_785194 [Xylogone sp. PMI_703]